LEQKFITPLKVGLLILALTYFLFTLHATFVTEWIGEWEPLSEPTRSWIMVTDISAFIFLVFRFLAGIIASATAILYFIKKGLPEATFYKMIRIVIIFEGLYWIGLLPSAIWGLVPTTYGTIKIPFTDLGFSQSLLISTGIPCIVGSIGIPVSLFLLAKKLSPTKPQKAAIKWALIAGFFYALSLWLNNTGMWIIVTLEKGTDYVFNTPEYLTSFIITIAGLLILTTYTGYFAKKSFKTERFEDLSIRTIGALTLTLGLYFLWNYLTWIFFGGWNEWYAWILGHNLDLWMLALPLVGLPLLFYRKKPKETPTA